MNITQNNLLDFVAYTPNKEQLTQNLYRKTNELVTQTNSKTNEFFTQDETFTGAFYYLDDPSSPKPIFQKTFLCGALPNAGLTNTAHNLPITADWMVIKINGTARKPTAPIGFTTFPIGDLFITVSATNIVISSTLDWSAFTYSKITLWYTKG